MQQTESQKLLTIAIPTYNRSYYLNLNLSQLCKQLSGHEHEVELIVSNDDSPDDSDEVVKSFISHGCDIKYNKNKENLGAHRNFIQCLKMTTGKYLLLFGDDDVFLDGSLTKLLDVLRNGEYGAVYLNVYGYKRDFIKERPINKVSDIIVYSDVSKYINRVNFMITFMSSNIVNTSLMDKHIRYEEFTSTWLTHTVWLFSAMFNAEHNASIEEYLIAAKVDNRGGYRLCEVFGVNFNKIFDFFIGKGYSEEYFVNINKKMLKWFFPSNILIVRDNKEKLIPEDYYSTLYPLYCNYLDFWLFTVPAIKLPYHLAMIWCIISCKLLSTASNINRVLHQLLRNEKEKKTTVHEIR
jgi:abequosyltransferase